MSGPVIDLFAGPGGWDIAAHALGIEPLGIELDDAACATRELAGLRTLQADVAGLKPEHVLREHFAGRGYPLIPLWGLIASPPCQAFSMAGKGEGRASIESFQREARYMARGHQVDRVRLDEECGDDRAHLVLEPLRWALALMPRWIACEQVEPVLPIWETIATALRTKGYSTWTGVLSAEQYGVPQTRKRAILLASLDGPVRAPAPTHQRYIPPRRMEVQEESLFAAPEPERIVAPEERELLPWVSMAEALGWGMVARPYPVIAGGTGGGPDLEKVGGSSAREVIYEEQEAGRWAGTFSPFGRRTLSGTHEDGEWLPEDPEGWHYRNGNQPNAAVRPATAPAPTLHFGHALNSGVEWTTTPDEPWTAPTHLDRRQTGGDGTPVKPRAVTEPAPTMTAAGMSAGRDVWTDSEVPLSEHWASARPSTTVAGDPRVHPPGHKVNGDDLAAGRDEYEGRAGTNAVRVSIHEALVLQSFPPGYPVQGTKTKQFEQVGNAVPPLLAWHVLREVMA